jgi:hypothetical protein
LSASPPRKNAERAIGFIYFLIFFFLIKEICGNLRYLWTIGFSSFTTATVGQSRRARPFLKQCRRER